MAALVRNDTRIADSFDVDVVPGDILKPETLSGAFKGAHTVYHLAGLFSLEQKAYPALHEVNVLGTRNVVEACLEAGVSRLVYCSSVQALARKPHDQILDENRPLVEERRGAFAYGLSKANGEREVLRGVEMGLHACMVNPTGVIGPDDYKPSSMGQALLDMCRGTMPALVNGGFNWVDVRDVIRGTVSAGEKGLPGERYLLSGTWAHVTDIAALTEEYSGTKRPSFVCPIWLARISAPISAVVSKMQGKEPVFNNESLNILTTHRRISHEKSARELGYTPRPLRTSIKETIDWFRQENYF